MARGQEISCCWPKAGTEEIIYIRSCSLGLPAPARSLLQVRVGSLRLLKAPKGRTTVPGQAGSQAQHTPLAEVSWA